MVIQQNFVRLFAFRLAYLIMIAVLFSILANLFVFFSRSEIMNVEKRNEAIYSTSYHVPKINWEQPDVAKGRLLEQYDNGKITRAYQNAWYFLNEALRTKSNVGLEDFFADPLVEEIEKLIAADHDYFEDRVDLDHDIQLHLFSIDKQVIAFKDRNVRIKRKVLRNKKIVFEEELFKNYEVVMTVSDGKWRILHMKEMKRDTPIPLKSFSPHFVMDSLVTYVVNNNHKQGGALLVNCKKKAAAGFHKIKPGETLYRLSKKYNVTVKQLMKWNRMSSVSGLKVCSHVSISPPKIERKKIVLVTPRIERGISIKNRAVKKGETIYTISKELGIEPAILRQANDMKDNTLEEGQLIKMPNLIEINTSKIESIKGLNYYNQSSPWLDFWVDFDPKIIRKDMRTIKALGMNTIRVFVPSDGVVPGLHFNAMLDKLERLLDEAVEFDIDVVVTLFDFPVSFELSYYTRSERQLEDLLTRLKDHPALIAWDLKNEPDLDFERHGKKKVIEWLSYLIEKARIYDPNHLLTIGWSNPEVAVNLSEELDFVSFHYYRDPKSLKLDMLKLKQAVKKPLLLGEFGIPSNKKWYYPVGYSKDEQSDYLLNMKNAMEDNHLPYLLWTLHDFDDIPTEVFGYKKWAHSKQKYFGLLDKNGKKKPSYYIFAPK